MNGLTIVAHVHISHEKRGRRRLVAGKAPKPSQDGPQGAVARLTRLMALAIHFEGLLQRGEIQDMAQIARLGHVSRARVTQIMNLRLLAPDIQEALLDLPLTTRGRDRLKYHHIHPLTVTASWKRQREMWSALVQKTGAAG